MLAEQPKFVDLILISILLTSCYTDLRYGKIYNVITIPSCIAGILLNYLALGRAGLSYSFLGLAAGAAMLLPFYLAGVLGGGNVKLFAAIGAFKGFEFVTSSMIASLAVMAVTAVFITIIKRNVLRQSKNIFSFFISLVLPWLKTEIPGKKDGYPLSTGFAVLYGVIAVYYLR